MEQLSKQYHYFKPVVKLELPKKINRCSHQYCRVPIDELIRAVDIGRGKYRAIICIVWLSMFWDGWKPRKGVKRIKSEKTLFTRRVMKNQFGYSEGLIRRGISDLKSYGRIIVATKGFYSPKNNTGTFFKLQWMSAKGKQCINVYWGLISSDLFLDLSITLQAVLLMLHSIHSRKKTGSIYVLKAFLNLKSAEQNYPPMLMNYEWLEC